MSTDDFKFEKYLEHWIKLKQLDGTLDKLTDYWILGRVDRQQTPRWSIMRNVLRWVE